MINVIAIHSLGPKGCKAQFLQDAETNAADFGEFKSGYFMYIGPGSEETWKIDKYPDNPKGNGMNLQNTRY